VEPIHYLRALRRRWWVIVLSVVVSVTAAWFAIPPVAREIPTATSSSYEATTVLWDPISSGNSIVGSLGGMGPISIIARLPDVATIAGHQLGKNVDALIGSGQVSATPDSLSGFLDITANAPLPHQAQALSTAFSDALAIYLRQLQGRLIDQQQSAIRDELQAQVKGGASPGSIGALKTQIVRLERLRSIPVGLVTIQEPVAQANLHGTGVTGSTYRAPKSRTIKLALAALIGLLAGLAIALTLERFDTRIRNRRSAEEYFGLPILAEIPVIPRKQGRQVVVTSHPTGQAADAFRLLGASVVGATAPELTADAIATGFPSVPDGGGNGYAAGTQTRRPRTLLVTSPGPSDGKTTSAANLAAVYGELGLRVTVVSCDLRRPALHRLFGVPIQPGLAELLRGAQQLEPADVLSMVMPSGVSNVSVLPSGTPPAGPGELLGSERMRQVLTILGHHADMVVLDCTPVLVASDVAALLPEVDAVLLVARAGSTRAELAERTTGVLHRLRAPVVGVALNGAKEISMPSSYRRYYRPNRKLRREAKSDA
jgi:capsular exopolysaccharide synthesis family protein